jgi:hypothetical protein
MIQCFAARRPRVGLGMKALAVLTLTSGLALVAASGALATEWGYHGLQDGACCSGQPVNGTRATINVTSSAPASTRCIAYADEVEGNGRHVEAGVGHCGPSGSIDGTCAHGSMNLIVETYNGSSYTCYQHPTALLNTSYSVTVDDAAVNGHYWAYINGTQLEGQTGFAARGTSIFEWAEYTGSDCFFGGSVSFTSWQRWSPPSWTTVQSANTLQQCWTVGGVSSGAFNVSH